MTPHAPTPRPAAFLLPLQYKLHGFCYQAKVIQVQRPFTCTVIRVVLEKTKGHVILITVGVICEIYELKECLLLVCDAVWLL
jgi:hypothetical protein